MSYKQYYERNKERIKARAKAYYAANKEKCAEKMKEYAAANRQKLNAYKTAWARAKKSSQPPKPLAEPATHKTCTKCALTKSIAEFYKCSGRKAHNAICKACNNAAAREWSKANRDLCNQRSRKHHKDARVRNPDRVRQLHREAKSRWWENNPERARAMYAAQARKRFAAKVRAIPKWTDLEAVAAIYLDAQKQSAQTGIKHHVDHIVPLISPLVCGLHVEHNLRVVPADFNWSKNNRWWPDMPEPLAP